MGVDSSIHQLITHFKRSSFMVLKNKGERASITRIDHGYIIGSIASKFPTFVPKDNLFNTMPRKP